MRLTTIPQVNPDIFGEALCARLKFHCKTDEERFEKLVAIVRHTAENYSTLATAEADGDSSVTPYLVAFDNAIRSTRFTAEQSRTFDALVRYKDVRKAYRKLGKDVRNSERDVRICCEKIAIHYAKGDVEAWGR